MLIKQNGNSYPDGIETLQIQLADNKLESDICLSHFSID